MRQARFDMVDGQHSRFAMLDRRHGAEDVVGAVDRRNHYRDYKPAVHSGSAWNKGRIVRQKRPFEPKHVWAIRVRLEIAQRTRELALSNLAIDSKLHGCDLVKLRVADVYAAG